MRHRFFALLVTAAAFLAGCDQSAVFESLVPKGESRAAQDVVAKIAAHDFSAVEAMLDPDLRTPDLHARLEEISKLLPAGSPKSVRVVGAITMKNSSNTTSNLTLEYEYPAAWLLAAVLLESRDDKFIVKSLNLVPRSQSMEMENRFTLDGKGPLHYFVLVLTVAIPLFVLYALFLCVRTKFEKRKWLWVMFVAIGLVQFSFNWSSGSWTIQPLSFALLGGGFAKNGPYAPWIFTFAIPLGAILFLLRRQSLQRNNTVSVAESVPDRSL